MIPSRNETYIATLYRRKENSEEYEDTPAYTFKCRPVGEREKNEYIIMQGLISESKGLNIIATRLPNDIKVDDRVVLNGKSWLVESIGYYMTNARLVSAYHFNETALNNRFPKGIKLV